MPRVKQQVQSDDQTRVAPVIISKTLEAAEQQVGQDNPRRMSSTGEASIEPALIEPVERPVDQEKLAMLAFMEEPVTVYIQTTTNKQDEQVFEVFVNGKREFFRRGETKTVKRKFIEAMVRAKVTTYEQREEFDDAGVRTYVNIPHTGLRYPFSVVSDPNPRGADWLRATLAQA